MFVVKKVLVDMCRGGGPERTDSGGVNRDNKYEIYKTCFIEKAGV